MAETDREASAPAEEVHTIQRRPVMVGFAVVALLLLAGAGVVYKHFSSPVAPVVSTQAEVTGKIDYSKAMRAHPSYKRLVELQQEYQTLKLKVKSLSTGKTGIGTPKIDKKPFDDSVFQKNAQDVMAKKLELDREKKKLEEEFRQEMAPRFDAIRQETDAIYVNALVNINIKLENADTLRLTDESIADLKAEKHRLQLERGEKQMLINEQNDKVVRDYLESKLGPRYAELRESMGPLMQEGKAKAMQKLTDASKRNAEAMEKEMAESLQRQMDRRMAEEQLRVCAKDIRSVEDTIFNDISSQANRLAIIYHLNLIIAENHPQAESSVLQLLSFSLNLPYNKVLFTDAQDLTEELIQGLADNK